jgi:hypothetical protein
VLYLFVRMFMFYEGVLLYMTRYICCIFGCFKLVWYLHMTFELLSLVCDICLLVINTT